MPTLASRGNRLLAQILDGFIALLIIAVPALLYLPIMWLGGPTFPLGMALIAGATGSLLYLLFSDGFANGQSLGKRAMGIAAVDATSYRPCTFWQSFLRNLLLEILGLIDWIFFFGRRRQRLGDMAANTLVVDANWLYHHRDHRAGTFSSAG